MSAYRMLAYFGSMISTAFPRISSSRLSPNTTSPSPPVFAAGAHSAATITMYTAHPPRQQDPPDAPADPDVPPPGPPAGHRQSCNRRRPAWAGQPRNGEDSPSARKAGARSAGSAESPVPGSSSRFAPVVVVEFGGAGFSCGTGRG